MSVTATTNQKSKPTRKFTFTITDCSTATDEELMEAWNFRIPITGIKIIGFRHSPSMDAHAAFYILRNTVEGRKLFPGVEQALPAVISETKLRNANYLNFKGFLKALKQGYLLIGLGKGPLDEHGDRKSKISCTELVKRHLDLYAEKRNRDLLGPVIEYINYEDNHGDNLKKNLQRAKKSAIEKQGEPVTEDALRISKEESEMLGFMQTSTIAGAIKKGYETIEPADEQGFLNVFNTAQNFIAFHVEQRELFLKACAEYDLQKDTVQASAISLPGENYPVLMTMVSDNRLAAKAIQSKNPKSANRTLGILLLVKKTAMPGAGKQFVIMPQAGFEQFMPDVLRILQQKISFKRTGKGLRFDTIGQYGTHYEVPELYFDDNMNIIMNGSKADPDAPGLIGKELGTQDVVNAIQIVVKKQFDTRNQKQCQAGICVKVANGTSCPLYSSCLSHCKAVQAATKKQQPTK
ncbi:MAG: hypothetical protein WCG20_00935 [bacterium]